MTVARTLPRALLLAAGLACVDAGCGGLCTTEPCGKTQPADADVPRLDGSDGYVPIDSAPMIDERPAVDTRPALNVSDSAAKSIGPAGDFVKLGPATFTVPGDVFSGKTLVNLTVISVDGSPPPMRPGALGPVFQIAVPPNTQVNDSQFTLVGAPQSLGYPADRLAIAFYDPNNGKGYWNPYTTKYDGEFDVLWAKLWSYSGTRIVGVLLRCNSNDDCSSPLTCGSGVCQ